MNDEEAKAVREVAKTTGVAIEAGRELGGFFSMICGDALKELAGTLTDQLKYYRYNRLLQIWDRVAAIHKARGIEGRTIPISLKCAIPMIENLSLEDDESVQDLWAGLIANATDPDKRFQIKKVHIDILSSLEPLDAMILKFLSRQGWNIIPGPHSPGFNSERISEELRIQICEVEISLQNLSRLGCLTGEYAEFFDTTKVSTGLNVRDKNVVCRLSVLGTSLLNACEV
jgi:predicted DNA-binding transcriptional regulator